MGKKKILICLIWIISQSVDTPHGYRQLGYTLSTPRAQENLENIATIRNHDGVDFSDPDEVVAHLVYGEGAGFSAIDQNLRDNHSNNPKNNRNS